MARTAKSISNTDTITEPKSGEIEQNPIKRPRGRPRKSASINPTAEQPKAGAGTSTRTATEAANKTDGFTGLHSANFQVENTFVEQPDNVQTLFDNIAAVEPPKRRGRVSKDAQAVEAATELVTVANILAVAVAGPSAGMNIAEEALITSSLARTIQKAEGAEKVAEKITPFVLIGVTAVWAMRIGKTVYDNNKDKAKSMAEKLSKRSQEVRAEQQQRTPKNVAPDKVDPSIENLVSFNGYLRSEIEQNNGI